MSKKKKRNPYQELYLEELTKDFSKQKESEEIFDELLSIIKNGFGNSLSFYERKWFYNIGSANYQIYKNGSKYDPQLQSLLDTNCLDDFKFIEVFRDYWNDLEGYKTTFKVRIDYIKTFQQYVINTNELKLIVEEIPISDFEKQTDITYLNTKYEEWSNILAKNNHSDVLLNMLVNYTNHFKKEYIDNVGAGSNWIKSHKKTLLLRSKFMYLLGKEIFRNSTYFDIIIGQNRIEYNYDSHCHIAIRHFSLGIGQNDKSHFYKDIDLKNVMDKLPKIFQKANDLNIYQKIIFDTNVNFPDCSFLFEYNNQVYTFWVGRKEKSFNGNQIKFIQVTSFYPNERTKYPALPKIYGGELEGKKIFFFVDKN